MPSRQHCLTKLIFVFSVSFSFSTYMHHGSRTIPCIWEALGLQQRGTRVHYIGVDTGVKLAYFLFSHYDGLAGLFFLH
ncbi:hypothetical protein N431DRAFT_90131 [Stipitochalara longipes BDJ]|nr:hypothetical protein N431DRAFT_90131 [Stipitochalara longipes BDJ]